MRTIRVSPGRTPFETKIFDGETDEFIGGVYRLEVVFEAGEASATGKMYSFDDPDPEGEPEEVFVWFGNEDEVADA